LLSSVQNLDEIIINRDFSFLSRLSRWKAEFLLGYPFYSLPGRDIKMVYKTILVKNPKVIIIEHFELLVPLADCLMKIKKNKNTRIILMSHGLHSQDFFYDNFHYKGIREIPKRIFKKFYFSNLLYNEKKCSDIVDLAFTLNEVECSMLKWMGFKSSSVIPPVCFPEEVNHSNKKRIVGFVGSLTHPINLLGLLEIISELSLINHNIEIRIVGGTYKKIIKEFKKYPFIKYLGKLDNKDLKSELADWSMFLHPIFIYGKGRSIKIAKALEWGLPILSTSAGVRGYNLRPNIDYIHSENPRDFTEKLVENSENKTLLNLIRENSISFRDKNFTLENARKFVIENLKSIL
jgi:glycosyltransferase involved in cell wall biosynthesis